MSELAIFILALIAPFLYWRGLFYVASHTFDRAFTRDKTGLQVHHAHYGILFVLIGIIALLFTGKNDFIIALLGLGLGLILDEFIPSLLMPGNRPLELEVYRKSFLKTVFLFLTVIATILIIELVNNGL